MKIYNMENAINKLSEEIIELVKTKSIVDTAKACNVAVKTVRRIIKDSGILFKKSRLNMSTLALNINYFKEIDSNEKAYWLGYVCADGNVKKTNNKVTLASKDLEVIEGFKKSIGAEHAITKIENFDKRTNKVYTRYTIQIGNELFTEHLINLGVTSNKTNVLDFPKIDEKYYPYFIAGLFDGDGSVMIKGKKKNRITINLISTKEILNHINEHILTKFSIEPKYRCLVSKNKKNVWKMYLYADAHKFLEYIYYDDDFEYYLKRKRDIYLNNIETRKNVRHFRKINQYDSNMNLIKTWNSQKEIGNETGWSESTLNAYLRRGNRFGFFKNYIWKYVD